jgi:microcystin degradation protein MlrC
MLEMHGIDISKVKILIVKSRGHYRAGFDEFFSEAHPFAGSTTPGSSSLMGFAALANEHLTVPLRRRPNPVVPPQGQPKRRCPKNTP